MNHFIFNFSMKNSTILLISIFFFLFFKNTQSFEVKEISPGFFVHFGQQEDSNLKNKGDIANIGFIIGKDSIAVVDTGGSPRIGEKLLKQIKQVSNLPISHVFITHSHPDHFFGTEAFLVEDIKIIGHEKLERSLISNFEFYKNLQSNLIKHESFRNARLVLPNETVKTGEKKTYDLGNREIEVKAWKSGHTDNDLSVFDKTTGFFWSENIFIDRIPTIRASILGWKSNLEEILKMDIKKIVPGHGMIAGKEKAITPMLNYFNRLIDEVRIFHKTNKTLKDAQENIAKENLEGWLLFQPYHAANITKTFTELEWE